MRKIDRLIVGELFGPWAFGVGMFTVLIMAGSFLYEFTRLLSEGASPIAAVQLLLLLTPGIAVKTLSMAMLLGTLLSFGRLSGESEITALKAAGVSLTRIMLPVGIFGTAVAVVAFFTGNYLVPWASSQAMQLRVNINNQLNGMKRQSISNAIYKDGELQAWIVARDFNVDRQTLSGASFLFYNKDGKVNIILSANELKYEGEDDWRITNGAELRTLNTNTVTTVASAWPETLPKPKFSIEDLLSKNLRDLDVFSMEKLKEQVDKEKQNPIPDKKQIANLEFGYWNKIALPLAAIVFGLVGAPLGIRNHRTGAAAGFWLSVIIIFAYLMLTNVMSIMAQGWLIPSWMASFVPILVGLASAAYLIRVKNN